MSGAAMLLLCLIAAYCENLLLLNVSITFSSFEAAVLLSEDLI